MRRRAVIPAILLAGLPAGAGSAPGRYIVELRAPAAAGRGDAAAEARRARVREEQARVRARVEDEGAVVVGQVDTVANALLVRATPAQAARLAEIPGVLRVRPERRFHRLDGPPAR